jgi:predicted phage-related endonuclease
MRRRVKMNWNENRVEITPPKRCKKLTGTRFAAVLGLDRWTTPFETWCAVTRTYEKPFEDNKYTIAGKTIEPKVVDYLNRLYFGGSLKTPTDVYGENYFQKTWGDFFPKERVFGGMWDALAYNDKGEVESVVEIKTTGRVEDWADGKAPHHYALQACLYAYLLGVDHVVMVASFLEEKDYVNPEAFEPSIENTIMDEFLVSERYPQFDKFIEAATEWWDEHVVTGISPAYDEKADKDVLAALRKNVVESKDDLATIIEEAERLKTTIDAVKATVKSDEKRLKELTESIKAYCSEQFRDGDNKVEIEGNDYVFTLSRSVRLTIDEDALKADGIYDKYAVPTETFRFTQTKRK